MGLFDNALRHFIKPAKTNSRRHYRMPLPMAEQLEPRMLLSTFVVTTTSDGLPSVGVVGSLRWAIQQANANTSAPNTITFQAGLTGTITTQEFGPLVITAGTTTIDGPGANMITVSGDHIISPFQIDGPAIASVSGLTISGGDGGSGGGIINNGNLTLTDCAISGNIAEQLGGGGGGIYNNGQLTLNDCTVANNDAEGGGGIYNANTGTMTMTNSTVSGNSSGVGGGIDNLGTATISDSTLSANFADAGGGISNAGTLTLNDTVIAGNTLTSSMTASDVAVVSGQLTGSNDLIGTGGSGGLTNGVNGNIVGVANPLLGPLSNYGGPTETIDLLTGSSAIDAGNNSLIPAGVTTDQRGVPRIIDGTVDIGAYESNAPLVVTTLADSGAGSLRAAIASANADAGPDSITFQGGLTGTITLTSGQLELTDTSGPTTITGPGANVLAVSGDDASRIFQIDNDVGAAISGLTITDGNNTGSTNYGGGIQNNGTLTLTDSALTNNTSTQNGGGIISTGGLDGSGSAILSGCTISGNTAPYGGGVFNQAPMTIINCTIAGNSAGNTGGGIENYTFSYDAQIQLTAVNDTISNNTAGTYGAGVALDGGTDVFTNTIIAGNTLTGGSTASDIGGPVAATGSYNLIGAGGSGGLVNLINGNLMGVANPMLGTLQNNGGTTDTMAVLAGSPAIGEGSTALAAAAGVTTDQIGTARGDPSCIGAFELAIANQTTSNGNYVNALYSDILNRSADTTGFDNWTGYLNNGTESYSQVALGFTGSLEFYNDTINSFYEDYLGRAATTAELANYASMLPQGVSLETIRVAVASLPEFITHNDPGGTNDGFITALYSQILDRSPDGPGLSYWETVLAGAPGASAQVAAGVIYSAESYDDLINGYYETYLHRAATSDEIAAGEGQFVLGVSDQTIIAGIISSPEYLTLNGVT